MNIPEFLVKEVQAVCQAFGRVEKLDNSFPHYLRVEIRSEFAKLYVGIVRRSHNNWIPNSGPVYLLNIGSDTRPSRQQIVASDETKCLSIVNQMLERLTALPDFEHTTKMSLGHANLDDEGIAEALDDVKSKIWRRRAFSADHNSLYVVWFESIKELVEELEEVYE